VDALHSAPSFAMGFAHFIAQVGTPFWAPLTLALGCNKDSKMNSTDKSPSGKIGMYIIYAVIIIPLYLFVYPLITLKIVLDLFPKTTNFNNTGWALGFIPSKIIDLSTVLFYIFLIIAIIYIRNSSKKGFLKILFVSYCYAFAFAPGAVGGEGFGLPAPFPLAVFPPGFASHETLRGLYVLFSFTWLVSFVVTLGVFIAQCYIKPGDW